MSLDAVVTMVTIHLEKNAGVNRRLSTCSASWGVTLCSSLLLLLDTAPVSMLAEPRVHSLAVEGWAEQPFWPVQIAGFCRKEEVLYFQSPW